MKRFRKLLNALMILIMLAGVGINNLMKPMDDLHHLINLIGMLCLVFAVLNLLVYKCFK